METEKITKEEVLKVARLARLELDDEAIEEIAPQLGDILKYMETLENIDTKGVEPTFHTITKKDITREDIAGIHLPKDKTLANAPQKDEDAQSFIVPKVI
ncbi:MAG: Asp-tRNA(Asn)/Glu-tRNA(Gln) amidotransferase subunit GatC [Deltaproteobacteria bacterium]|nr:Asp-tRNA(Asn)/Glu-tRNA(Gln) amidotransferase subunit GatC [Deltaproteobacteria bacterium]